MKLFAQIMKVDEARRTVIGRAVQEVVDKRGEIFDYMSSKPHFQKWSADIAKDTDGKSMGNVRAMHGKVAAGKLTGIEFNDAEKAIDIEAKIVDPAEWEKVSQGVYTGFSIGGSYVEGSRKVEKVSGRDVTRYTASPNEISLVDRPCIPTAKFFDVLKADGVLTKVEFKPATDPIEVTGSDDEVISFGKMLNENQLTMADALAILGKAMPAFLADKKGEKDDSKKDDNADETDDSKAKKAKAAKDSADCEAAEKLLKDVVDALAKLDDPAAKERLAKLNAVLGAGDVEKQKQDEAAAALAKLESDRTATLAKVVADAVAPLQKALDAANARIEEIAKAPARTTIALRAVSKSDDVVVDHSAEVKKLTAPLVDPMGEKHEAAGLIKALHTVGGSPLMLGR